MFHHYYHPFYQHGFGRRFYPWGGWGWPSYGSGYAPWIGFGGAGAVQSANNTWIGNFNRSAYSRQRLINTGDMTDTEQTSTPTVIG